MTNTTGSRAEAARSFLQFAWQQGVLRFGSFLTKAGRTSPYFFNTGEIKDGAALRSLAHFYADAYLAHFVDDQGADVLFGSAYKGIPLVSAIACALAEKGTVVPFAFNRKEVKDHGERGRFVGAPLAGRVLIVDDVLSAGTSARECAGWIRAAGALPMGLLVALDRQEQGSGQELAAHELRQIWHVPTVALATATDIVSFLQSKDMYQEHVKMAEYLSVFGNDPMNQS